MDNVYGYVEGLCAAAKKNVAALNAPAALRNAIIRAYADALEENSGAIVAANALDLSRAAENGVPEQMIDRLTLTADRVAAIAASVRDVAALPDPLGSASSP